MTPLCSGVFRELFLVSAAVHSVLGLFTSSIKQSEVQTTEKRTERFATIRNIGIKLCQVPAGPCTIMSCSLGSRCIESRSGKAVCIKDMKKFYPSRSQQQKRDQKRKSVDNILHEACREGDLSRVQGHVDINGQYGRTSVMLAARRGHRDVFAVVMRKGGNASLVDIDGDNILHLACLGGNVMLVKYILTQNIADINCRGFYGRTPLMFAATEGHRDVFDLVMRKGGNASLVDINGDNILHLACLGGNVEMIKYILFQNISDINCRGLNGRKPLMFAATEGHRDVFDLVKRKGGNASVVDINGENILHSACLGGNVEMVKYILSQNISDINCKRVDGRTPLLVAAAEGHKDVFDLLVSKGGDVSAVDGDGSTILHVACFCGQVEMVKHILSQDIVDIHAKDKYGDIAVMIATRRKHIKVYDLIISQG
ncbi:ankyrin repeat domain-containing protein 29-like [Haliotis rufescens]|uniref:ankyrin repeat domain-containing protein 29-like n=1 Tax=Haliotis rufescens TaxID=6454 RepID=UPI00201EB557|nr:ankyrin repeat domain-containing protein 29-like [Haliotis rufescens]